MLGVVNKIGLAGRYDAVLDFGPTMLTRTLIRRRPLVDSHCPALLRREARLRMTPPKSVDQIA
jgi:hypothetical protein